MYERKKNREKKERITALVCVSGKTSYAGKRERCVGIDH